MTKNSKEENSLEFCPKCVQEFGLWVAYLYWRHGKILSASAPPVCSISNPTVLLMISLYLILFFIFLFHFVFPPHEFLYLFIPTSYNICISHLFSVQKPNSGTYNFVEVSGHNLESSQTYDFRIQYSHYKPVLNLLGGGGGGVKTVNRGTGKTQDGKVLKVF